jgi:uncharacterized cupin superfamily protein
MAVPEAKLVEKSGGLAPDGPGWFILNVADAVAYTNEVEGTYVRFEDLEKARFPHYGINIQVLQPGQPSAKYHAESNQESFLILEGECILIVEGQERRLRKWDFFNCAPMTRHITIGAGDGPCAILMAGARLPDEDLEYPQDPLAAKYDAQSPEPTSDPDIAYSDVPSEWVPGPFTWPVSQ